MHVLPDTEIGSAVTDEIFELYVDGPLLYGRVVLLFFFLQTNLVTFVCRMFDTRLWRHVEWLMEFVWLA